jgi:hypothetical protein
MPLITRRWYDIPLRAALVATLVGTVVTLSSTIGPTGSGILALYPVVFTSLMLILHPRIGGPPTAAVIANGGWGLMGFGIAVAVMHVTATRFGSVVALSLALATCVVWNLPSWPGLSRPSTSVFARFEDVDARHKAGHDDRECYFGSFAFSA